MHGRLVQKRYVVEILFVSAWLMPKIGPRGMEFARTRLEMKAIETILHLRRKAPSKMKNMIPDHVWKLAKPYGLNPEKNDDE